NNMATTAHAQGDYETALAYLKQSLDIMRQIGDKKGEGATLNNMATTAHAQGDYETALAYLKQSLDIMRQIGDKAGLCATLFNIGHIHAQKGEIQQAVSAWVTVYVIAKQINEFQALQALSKLAPQLGMPAGLEGWEMLAKRMKDEGGRLVLSEAEGMNGGESELEKIREFVQGLAQAHRKKSPEAQKYFEAVSKMAADPNAPPHYRELGKVLQKYMGGVKNPDLSGLPGEIAAIVQKALE
ncbi:MAG: tetratricopeptide repeat protein, partial [Chloroflexota bacterium]